MITIQLIAQKFWIIITLMVAASTVATCPIKSDAREIRQMTPISNHQFDASESHFAFLHDRPGQSNLLIVSSDKGTSAYEMSGVRLWSPRLIEKDEIMIVGLGVGNEPSDVRSTLYKCKIAKMECNSILNFSGGISSPLALEGGVLFVGAKAEKTADPMIPDRPILAYRHSDFYFQRDNDEPKIVSKIDAYDIDSVSSADGLLYFKMLMRVKGGQRRTSEIYSADIKFDAGTPQVQSTDLLPAVTFGKNIDTLPHISPSGDRIAFLSSSASVGGMWAYDIVVMDIRTGRELLRIRAPHPENGQFSRPVMTSEGQVRYLQILADSYELKSASVGTGNIVTLSRIEVSDVIKGPVQVIR